MEFVQPTFYENVDAILIEKCEPLPRTIISDPNRGIGINVYLTIAIANLNTNPSFSAPITN
jgi:hypothetical protein